MPNRSILLLLLTCLSACSDFGPDSGDKAFSLAVEDVSCTEAWLHVHVDSRSRGRDIAILRDGQPLIGFSLLRSDTVVVDTTLQPAHDYLYQAQRRSGQTVEEESEGKPARTLDTTSHAFTWQMFLLGDGAGSDLYDIAIINDTLAYAVGAIYKRDSLGSWDPLPYNLVKWNGQKWDLKRVTVQMRFGLVTAPFDGIRAFSPVDIWVTATDPIHWDGENWTDFDIRLLLSDNNLSISRAWGPSSSSMVFVGHAGSIVIHTNGSWQKLSSGTTLDVRDIWGETNPATGKSEIIAVASGYSPAEGKKLMRIEGASVTPLADEGLSWSLYGLWFVPGRAYYVVGAGIGFKHTLDQAEWKVYPSGTVTNYMSASVRGNGINDLFVVGSFMECVHFNGLTWHNYSDQIPLALGALGSIAVRGNLAIAVGYVGNQAAIVVGRR